jgi:hypothetical protein
VQVVNNNVKYISLELLALGVADFEKILTFIENNLIITRMVKV